MTQDFEYDYGLLPNVADVFIQYAYRNPDKYVVRVSLFTGEVDVFEKETGKKILNFFDSNLRCGRGNIRKLQFEFNDHLYEIKCNQRESKAQAFNLNTQRIDEYRFGSILDKFYEFLLSIDDKKEFEFSKWKVA